MKIKNFQYAAISAVALVGTIVSPAAFAQTTANAYVQHNIVSDMAGQADSVDPNLVNPWGMSQTGTSPFWTSNHDKGNTTLYNGTGSAAGLVVTIPKAAATTTLGVPTGQVAGNGASWKLSDGAASSFIFATEDGMIVGWNGGAAMTALVAVDNSKAGAVYKGLATNGSTTTPMLYATNFYSGNIDVFDGSFNSIAVSGGFKDPTIPAGFAPFNIWSIGGKLYVTYAKQNAAKNEDVAGAGNGMVDIFDYNGNLLQSLTSGGPLNSPWGVAVAPAGWGAFAGDVLVGNFGDGKINAFDPKTGNALGALQDPNGKTIVIQGLWALLFGNGRSADQNTLYFTAGPSFGDTKIHGLYGGIAPPSQVTGITNAASQASGPIAPGEIVEINGFTVGPSPLLANAVPTTGSVTTSVSSKTQAATSVTFNGTAAPILFASSSATSVIVPYSLAGSATASVVVTYNNNKSVTFTAQMAATAPGLFTLNESGTGEVVAYNSDGTVNGSSNPAARGSAVLLFGTGEGVSNPPGTDGLITTTEFFRAPQAQVSLSVETKPATVVYALSAPGLVSGVLMVEAILPTNPGAAAGAVPVVLTVGNASSPQGTTIFVK